uniref:J domain-containing protein n=1 Tax=Ditylenchus dipsaci TaxID=166011 RepID=A0A915DSL8_9BILA
MNFELLTSKKNKPMLKDLNATSTGISAFREGSGLIGEVSEPVAVITLDDTIDLHDADLLDELRSDKFGNVITERILQCLKTEQWLNRDVYQLLSTAFSPVKFARRNGAEDTAQLFTLLLGETHVILSRSSNRFVKKNTEGNNDETSKFNFYETLGIDKNASDQQIKDAYKRSALKYHPDRNLGNEEALENFKKISIAYSVLSDQNKRRQYDMTGGDPAISNFDDLTCRKCVRMLKDSQKRKNCTSAEMFFVPFQRVEVSKRLHFLFAWMTRRPYALSLSRQFGDSGAQSLRDGNHILCIYGDNFYQAVRYRLNFLLLNKDCQRRLPS